MYREALALPQCRQVHLTQILTEFPSDKSIPLDVSKFELAYVGDVVNGRRLHISPSHPSWQALCCM